MAAVQARLRTYLETHLASALLDAAGMLAGTTARLYWRGLVGGRETLALLRLAARMRGGALKIIRARLRQRRSGGRHDA